MNAREIMTSTDVWSSAESSDARSVARLMALHNVAAIPVLDLQGRLEGMITDRDLTCRLLAEGLSYDTPVSELMTTRPRSVHLDESFEDIELLMRQHRLRFLPVVDNDNRLQGLISLADLARNCGSNREAEHELVGVLEAVSLVTKL